MKRFLKYNKKVLGLALATLTLAACNDQWDDHYSDSALAGTNSGTIWQAMQQNPELSNFCNVAKACGYDKALQSTQAFTVFAPTNNNFSAEDAQSVIDLYNSEVKAGVRLAENRAIKEFLQNHIARYTYSVASQTNDSIIMMNGKYLVLTQNKFGGKDITSSNKLYENGVLFTLDKPTEFYNNLFEYIEKQNNGQPDGLDSMYNFWYDKRYYRYELDEESSVPGDIVNGKTTYLDSVMIKYNELFYSVGQINDEDSTFWMLVPDNTLAKQLIDDYSPYFMYHEQVDKYDSLRWYMPRVQIAMGGLFSMSKNLPLKNYLSSGTQIDSLMSEGALEYKYRKSGWGSDSLHYYQYGTLKEPRDPFAAGGIFYGAERIQCSNGVMLKTNQWNISKRETFLRSIVIDAERASRIIVDDKQTLRRTVARSIPTYSKYYNKVSNNSYLEIYPYDRSISDPEITFLIPNVLSGVKYDIYMVTVPADAVDTLVTEAEKKPSYFYISRLYKELDGYGPERDSISDNRSSIFDQPQYFLGDFDGTLGKGYGSGQDVDTICVAQGVEFPTCSWGTRSQVQLRVLNWVDYDPTETYDRTMRIDCIIFRPQEFGPLKNDE
jgi:uncharacterized surface protein with fasciclin (FAS1) repeats